MNIEDMTTLVSNYLKDCEALAIDKDVLPQMLQTLGMEKCGDFFAIWDLPEVDGFYHFEVRFGVDPSGPLVVEWTYRPQV